LLLLKSVLISDSLRIAKPHGVVENRAMSVRIFYLDESYDRAKFCLSAIAIRHTEWKECFELVKEHRRQLKQDYGLFLRKEIHATDFVKGRGKISSANIGKWERSRIFFGLLQLVSRLPKVLVFNVCLDVSKYDDPQMVAWDRMLNRIERTLKEFENRELPLRRGLASEASKSLSDDRAEVLRTRLDAYRARGIIIADEGREHDITRAFRKMSVFNPIPSKYGIWDTGQLTRNITTERIIEDPVFKTSFRSYFIQLADCVAFALLKREVPPTPNVAKYGIHKMFDATISKICYRKASPRDPFGVVRK
jgi:hypothetical protein